MNHMRLSFSLRPSRNSFRSLSTSKWPSYYFQICVEIIVKHFSCAGGMMWPVGICMYVWVALLWESCRRWFCAFCGQTERLGWGFWWQNSGNSQPPSPTNPPLTIYLLWKCFSVPMQRLLWPACGLPKFTYYRNSVNSIHNLVIIPE